MHALEIQEQNVSVEEWEGKTLSLPQIDCPLVHRFAPGVYLREITMPAGAFIIGHEHITEHVNVVLSGKALVRMNGEVSTLEAPMVFISKPGVRKVLLILEEMRFITIHPTEETNLSIIESLVIRKSETFLDYQEDVKRLNQAKEELT